MSVDEEDEEEDLSPETSHPTAALLLSDAFFWDCTDEVSPFGNDTGADTLSFFRQWRKEYPIENSLVFLDSLLSDWEVVNDNWDVTESGLLQEILNLDLALNYDNLLIRDDIIIALAFGEILLDGTCSDTVKDRALLALQRQALPLIISFRGWDNPEEWLSRLERMQQVLRSV
ncbi:MAG: hypothetical protein V4671_26620 [Armatimonadota bacterium]